MPVRRDWNQRKIPIDTVYHTPAICPHNYHDPTRRAASDRAGPDHCLSGMRTPQAACGNLAQQIEHNRRILSSGAALRGFQRQNYPE